ncbi:MAG: Bcr/CflA family efflux MFS transporter [Alphaproteobacteria bacterium]|nr:Bcr/CflA family efflux MFS transporter [Alphaproteobacteria bacterium]
MPPPDAPVVDASRLAMLLALLVGTSQMSTSTYVSSMPALPAALDTDAATVQLTLTLFLAGSALGSLIWGSLADRFGRRPVLFAWFGLFILATLACALLPAISWLIAGRFLQAVGSSVSWVLSRAVVRDLYRRDEAARVLALIATAFAIAPVIGPVIGGHIATWFGWRWTFAFIGIVAGAIARVVPRLLPETLNQPAPTATDPRRIATNFATLLRHRAVIGYCGAMGSSMAEMFAFVTAGPFVLMGIVGVSAEGYGWLSAIVALAFMLGSRLSALSVRRLGHAREIVFGIAIQVLAGTSLALALAAVVPLAGVTGIVATIGPAALWLIGVAFLRTAAAAGAVEPFGHMAGAASSASNFLQMAVDTLGSLTVSLLEDGTAVPLAAAMLGAATLTAVSFYVVVRPRRERARAGA